MQVTHNNYTFSPATYSVIENGNLILEVGLAEIIISPAPGYSVSAGDFTISPTFSNPNVDYVTFTQSGDNVSCKIYFLPNAEMPSANLTIPLCIIGQANVDLILIGGIYNTIVGDNVSPSSQSNIAYSGSGSPGQTIPLFTESFSADSGYWMSVSPTAQIIEGNQSNYTINQTPVYNASNELISISYDVLYTFPLNDFLEDQIQFVVPKAARIYVPSQNISNWSIPTGIVPELGATRLLSVSGEEGAVYSIVISDGTANTNIASNVVMDSSGSAQYNINFPENTTGANISWSLEISGDLDAGLNPFIYITQSSVVQGIWEPETSTVLQGGFSVQNTGDYIIEPPVGSDTGEVLIQWLISSNNDVPLSIAQNVGNMPWENGEAVVKQVEQASNGSAIIADTSGIEIGMRFSADGSAAAPLDATVTAVLSSSITYSPVSVTIDDPINITFTNSNGFDFNPSQLSAELLDPPTSATVEGVITINRFGDTDTVFKLNLDNLLEVVSLTPVRLSTNTKPDAACCDTPTSYFIDANTLADATKIFEDNAGQILAQGSLNYSDGNGYRLWSGTEFSNTIQNCATNNCGIFGPFILNIEVDGVSDEACCNRTTTAVYLDTNSLDTATTMYLNTDKDPVTFSGSYSNGSVWRVYDAPNKEFTTPSANCPACATSLILCYASKDVKELCCGRGISVQRWVAQGETFANNNGLFMNPGLTTPATLGYYSDNVGCNIIPE